MDFEKWLGETLISSMKAASNSSTASTASTKKEPVLSVEAMKKVVEELEFMQRASTFAGLEVVVIPDSIEHRPKLQLSAHVCEVLSPEVIAATNAWMVGFFGTTMIVHNMLKDDEAIVYQSKRQVYMNPRMYARFRKAMADYRR